jgi:hypothetical protein
MVAPMDDLATLLHACRQEREDFLKRGETSSPACVELFRRAFAGEEAAWDAILRQIFQPEIRRWVEAAARVRNLSADDVEEAIQETHLAFWRYAPKAPTLLQSGDLDPIIAYLKKCVMSAVTTVARRLPPLEEVALADLAGQEDATHPDEPATRPKWRLPVERTTTETWENVQEIVDELKKILQSDLERLIAQECLLNGTPPREFLADYADWLPGETDAKKLANLNQALKRIRLRAEKSPTFQKQQSARRKTNGPAFLTYSEVAVTESGETMMADDAPCAFDEATLLAYVQGNAPAELCAAIERSPPCVAAARRLAAEIETLLPLLRLALCPDAETLIDYYAKQLPGAQQLVIHNHVQRCRQCQGELAMYAAIDEVPLQAASSFLQRLFDAILLLPTQMAAPVRGALPSLHYRTQIRTPAIDILIFTQKQSGKARTWTMRGELRTEEGLHFTQVEKVVLRTVDPPEGEAAELTTTLDADGMFVFRRLEAGSYALQIFTDAEEILIRTLKVGDEG